VPLLIANWCKDFLALLTVECQYHPVSFKLKHTILVLPFCVARNSLFQDFFMLLFFYVALLMCGIFAELLVTFFLLHVLCIKVFQMNSLCSAENIYHTHTDHLLCMGHNTWQGFLLIPDCWSRITKSLLPCLAKWACIFPRPGIMISRVLCKKMAMWNTVM